MPVRMLPEPPADKRMAELDAILQAPRDSDLISPNPPNGAATPPRQPPHRADRITRNMTVRANATPNRAARDQRSENERMAIVEGEREREMVLAAKRYAEITYLRAKGAA